MGLIVAWLEKKNKAAAYLMLYSGYVCMHLCAVSRHHVYFEARKNVFVIRQTIMTMTP